MSKRNRNRKRFGDHMVEGLGQNWNPADRKLAELEDPGPGKHLWHAMTMFRLSEDEAHRGMQPGNRVLLDQENLAEFAIGCFKCERTYPMIKDAGFPECDGLLDLQVDDEIPRPALATPVAVSRRPEVRRLDEPVTDGISVTSVLRGNSYACEVSIGDLAFIVPPDNVVPYVAQILTVAMQASHDCAVMRQMTEKLGLPLETAAVLVNETLRPDRPPTNHVATHPLEFYAGVGQNPLNGSLSPHVVISVTSPPAEHGRWRLADVRSHAQAVLEVGNAVDLDTGYFRALVGTLEQPAARASAVVNDLANFHEPWVSPE